VHKITGETALSHFFISYSSKDSKFVKRFTSRMEELGFRPWIDKERIKATEDWRTEIDNAIHDCFAVVLVVTESSLESRYVTYEWSYALGKNKKVIQVAVDRDIKVHPKLEPEQYLYYSDKQFWGKFMDALRNARDGHKIISAEIANAEKLLDSAIEADWRSGINKLKDIEDKEATEALARGLEKKASAVSLECAFALCERTKFQDERALPKLDKELGKLAQTPTSTEVKTKIMRYIANFGNANAYSILCTAFETAPERNKTDVAKHLLRINIPENREFIKLRLSDDSQELQKSAIQAIAKFKYTEFNSKLEEIARTRIEMKQLNHSDKFEFLKLVFDTLGIVGDESNLEFLGTILQNERNSQILRHPAGMALANSGRINAVKILRRTFHRLGPNSSYTESWVEQINTLATKFEDENSDST
jgi:hypothetical protein